MATQQQIDAGFNAFYAAGGMGLSIYQQIAEVIKAAEQAAWQPIETIPSELINCGHEVLVSGGTYRLKAWFGYGEFVRVKCSSSRAYAVCGEETGWELMGGEEMLSPPTHWRPLPDAPTDINEKDLK